MREKIFCLRNYIILRVGRSRGARLRACARSASTPEQVKISRQFAAKSNKYNEADKQRAKNNVALPHFISRRKGFGRLMMEILRPRRNQQKE